MSPPEPDPVRVRAAARGWVTRCSKKLQELCATEEVDLVQLNDAIEEFDARLNVLDNAQSIVELELPDEKLEADIEAAAEFREKSRVPRIAATKIIANEQNESLGAAARADSASVGSQDARLPKLQLPTFSGDIKLWPGFWEQFEVAVDKSDMPDISKLSYLLSLLKGEAKLAVNGLSLTAANYKTACEILRKRYGRPERLIFCHIQDLLNLSVPKQPKTSVLWEMYDTLQSHVRSLEVLGISGSQYGVVLTPLILSRLPPDMRLEWAREGEQHEGDLDFLLKFLLGEIGRRERSQTFVKETVESVAQETRTTRVATAAALHITSGNKNCVLCGRSSHPVHKCYNLTKVPVGDRKSVLSEAHLCFKCLSPKSSGHDFRKCAVKCARCSGSHHMILCHNTKPQTHSKHTAQQSQDTDSSGPHAPTTSAATITSVATQADSMSSTGVIMLHKGMTCNPKGKSHVLLQTAKVKVRGSKGTADAVVLFDTGSDRTYMSERLVNAIGPEWIRTQHVSYASFGSSEPSAPVLRNVYSVSLCGRQGSVTITATEVPTICAAMYRPPLPPSVVEMLGDDVQLVDLDEGEITVDIVVGLDVYWRLMSTEVITLPLGLVAQRSVFGWIVSGSLADSQSASHCHVQVSHQLLCLNDVSESTIRQFWELESVGICESAESDPVMENFKMTVKHCEGRYSVALPWKSKSFKLLANEAGARRRLDKLSKKLAEDPALECRYNEALREMESTGVIHEVPQDEVVSPYLTYYLPHRPVVKEASVSTKIRPVFDASAKGPSGVSLNDCLETGPCLLPSLVEILIRFRRWKIALTSDIQKAFLQIRVRREDQDVHRFFWMDQDKVRIMRFDRVPFGNKSSPFLLNATIQWHLSQYPTSPVVYELRENMYVDDWLSGADDEKDACRMFAEANTIMGDAGMILTKWDSSSGVVSEMLHEHFEEKHLGSESVKVLGLKWSPETDCFSFGGIAIPSCLVITKRVILSIMSRLFDPLGLLTPFLMVAKCLFQDLWKEGIDWNQQVPETHCSAFLEWLKGLDLVKGWEIPRRYVDVPWRDAVQFELHAFCDASERGYGCCIYLRVLLSSGHWSTSLVISKAKLAPLKRITIPRLELMGALLGARLLVFVRKSLKLPEDVAFRCWTDSMVALAWIRNDPHKWKTFVSNRVAEIQSLTPPDHWQHCPGTLNPADLVTRGISAEDLIQSPVWLVGPPFLADQVPLCREDHECSQQKLLQMTDEIEVETSTVAVAVETSGGKATKFLDVERWSSLGKSLRVVGWILRFVSNARCPASTRQVGELTYNELCQAKVVLLKSVQEQNYHEELASLAEGRSVSQRSYIFRLSPFIGDDGLLRVKGRLQFSGLSETEKHPVIVPKGHLSYLLALHVHLSQKHAGVNSMLVSLRDQYWIVGARSVCKTVKRGCVACRRQDASSGDQPMAPLPSVRVTPSPPFATTGLDHGGPLFCCDHPGQKFYILLFTCAVVRAVHLEMVDALTAETTLLALRRFISRRGMPAVIMSDNAKGFKKLAKEQLKFFGPEGPKWSFIAPRAPWWGGWWERLIASVKSALKKSLGSRSLTRVELETSLHEIEGCINSRPLVHRGDGVDSGPPLTPSHFLLGRTVTSKPSVVEKVPAVTAEDLFLRLEIRSQVLEEFWSVWLKEYIRNLPPIRGPSVDSDLVKGTVVLVQDEQAPRLQWPLAVIEKVFPGRDGIVRTAEVRTAKGTLIRPIQRLHSLEIYDRISECSVEPPKFCFENPVEDIPDNSHTTGDQTPVGNGMASGVERDVGVPDQETDDTLRSASWDTVDTGLNGYLSRAGRQIRPPKKLDLYFW